MKNDYSYIFAAEFYKYFTKKKENIGELTGELKNFQEILNENKKIFNFLDHPNIKFSAKINTIKKISGSGALTSILMILIRTGRLKDIKNIIRHLNAFKDHSDECVNVSISTVFEINGKVLTDIHLILEKYIGKKISIKTFEDPDLIGGIKVKIGDLIIDQSVKRELQILKERLI